MFEPTTIAIVVTLFIVWGVQIFLSNMQMKRFHDRSQKLRRMGTLMSIGLAGNMYKRKVYVSVVVDEESNVVAAEELSGWTVLANAKPIPDMAGRSVWEIGRGDPPRGISSKTWSAIDHAASFIRKKVDPVRAAALERDAEEVG
jgi:DNA-binding transcriptional regulator of glucitol operon